MLLKKGFAHFHNEEFDDALGYFTRAIEHLQNPPIAKKKKFLGIEIVVRDDISRLVGNSVYDSLYAAYIARAVIYLRMKQYAEAVDDFNSALQLLTTKYDDMRFFTNQKESELVSIFSSRGVAFVRLKQWEKALADYTQVIEHGERTCEFFVSRLCVYVHLARWDDVFTDFDHALVLIQKDDSMTDEKRNKLLGDAYNCRAIALFRTGQHQESINSYTKAMELKPESAMIVSNRGLTYWAMGQYEQAIQDFSQVLEWENDRSSATAGLAITYHALGNVEEALRLWRMLVERDENFINLEWAVETLYWPDSLAAEVEKIITKLVDENPDLANPPTEPKL